MTTRALVSRALARLGLRRALVVARRPGADPAPVTVDPAIACGWVSPERAVELEDLRPGLGAEAEARLAAGDRCWAAWIDGRPVSARWVALESAYVPLLRTTLRLAPGEALIYDAWTAPDARRRGIASSVGRALADALVAEGVTELVGVVLPGNDAGLANAQRAGFAVRGTITSVGIGRRRLVRERRS